MKRALRPIAALALALALLLPTPAAAGATRFSLIASAAQTTTAQGGAIYVGGIREMVVLVDVTAVSGTTPQLTLYLQTSRDGGSTWFDLIHDGAVVLSAGAVEGQGSPRGTRNIVGTATATLKASAQYEGAIGDYVRVAWVISGTTPSFTFQVDAVGKN